MKSRRRLALVLGLVVLGTCAGSVRAILACETDAIRERVHRDFGDYDLDSLDVDHGIVALGLTMREGAGRVAVGLHASGTKLYTSIAGGEVDDATLAEVGGIVAGWSSDAVFQQILSDCGTGFPEATDPSAALRAATDKVRSRHGRRIQATPSAWSIGLWAGLAMVVFGVLPQRWRARGMVAVATIAAIVPLATMIAATIGVDWYATGDQALIELRARDVGTWDTPFVGPYSRYGWNHPGPLLFWVYAVPYRLSGGASWALLAAAGMINLFAAAATVLMAWRMGRALFASCVALGLVLIIRGLNIDCIDPWNPFVTVLPFALMIATAWAASEGDPIGLLLAVGTGSFLAQAHVAFALPVAALWIVSLRGVPRIQGWARIAAAGLLIVCWTPVLYDQLIGSGNLTLVAKYFLQDRAAIGWSSAIGLGARELAVAGPWLGYPEPGDDVVGVLPASAGDLLIPIALFVAAAFVAYRRRTLPSLRLQIVVALLAAIGIFTTSRISEAPAWYLIRWWWAIAMWWWISLAWSMLGILRGDKAKLVAGGLFAALALAISIDSARSSEVAYSPSLAAMHAITPAMIRAVGTKSASISEITPGAVPLAQGLALQLERHGIRVVVSEPEDIKYGRGRLAGVDSEPTVMVVAAGDRLENLQRVATERAPAGAEVQIVAVHGDHPTTLVAVLRYAMPAPY